MTRPYEASRQNINLESEIDRLRHQANFGPIQEARTLVEFGLRDNMSVLEVASGPGFVTEWLSKLVPNGSLTCVDVDPVLIKDAEQMLQGKLKCRHRFIESSVMDLKLDSNEFDFAFARLLFEHLSDPVAAASEILRVLKPGGRLVVAEGDSAFNHITYPVFQEADLIRGKLMEYQRSRGGNPMIGRQLWRILKSAGFEDIDLEAVVFHSGRTSMDWFSPQFNADRLTPLVKAGVISTEEQEKLRDALKAFLGSEDVFYMRILLMACGTKP